MIFNTIYVYVIRVFLLNIIKMNEKFEEKIVGITIGIRFARSFRLRDVYGEIIDDVLFSKDSPFNTKFFPAIQENSHEKTLYNPETTEYLRINTDDIILAVRVEQNFEKRFGWLKEDVFSFYEDQLFSAHSIKNIKRIGIIFTHKVEPQKTINEAISLFTKNTIKNPENFSLSFSQKEVSLNAISKKGVNDYKNVIYNFTEVEGSMLSEMDFQHYFNPSVEDLRDCYGKNIFDEAKSFLVKNYYSWLEKHEQEIPS